MLSSVASAHRAAVRFLVADQAARSVTFTVATPTGPQSVTFTARRVAGETIGARLV